ncbi:MAG: aldehyde ferredoxin oxidoreductase family protein [Chloroflexi bacterium]|nr:aldehyde ferredoxin oxidoreductase family protein [Chloroflexota bacterium]
MHGWAGKRLKVYLTEGKLVEEELTEEFRQEYLGGRGFNVRTVFDEIAPGIDPLSPENVLTVSTGPLAGTAAPGMTRWTVTAKSPLTGIIGDGNGGSDFAAELKFAGYDQIVVYGRAASPVYLFIKDSRVELRDASRLWGKTTWDTHKLIVKELHDSQIRDLIIGPAGENLVRFAKIITNMTRAGGKCGMGAVMGSKNLKAIVVRGSGSVKIASPDAFYQAAQQANAKLLASRFHRQVLGEEGTPYLIKFLTSERSLTTRNSQAGYFEGWEKLTSEAFESSYAVKHGACFSCPIACSHYYRVKDGPYATHGGSNQFGTLYPFTSRCGSDNLAASLHLTTLCDQMGIDTHSCGATISFAMEAWEKGLITFKDTDGLDLSWGNADSMIKLVQKIAYRQGFGDILAEGSLRASAQIPGSASCLTVVKGLECSSYYPGEGEHKIIGLAFATSPIGGSHHRGGFMGLHSHPKVRQALGEELARHLRDHTTYKGQGVLLVVENDFVAALNSMETCLLLCQYGLTADDLAGLVSAATGFDIDGDALLKIGERVFNVERAFNVREGIRRKDDTLPERFFVEKETPYGKTGINKAKFQEMLDEFYSFRGWDKEGVPTRKKLEELNLGYIAEQIPAS